MSVDDLIQQYHGAMENLPLQILRQNPTIALADAAEFLNHVGCGHLTGHDIYGEGGEKTAAVPGKKTTTTKKAHRKKAHTKKGALPLDDLVLLKQEARHVADRLVLDHMDDGYWIAAADLREVLGGSGDKMRGILNRLISQNRIEYRGVGTATRYRIVK